MGSMVSPAEHDQPLVLPTGVTARQFLPAVLEVPSPPVGDPRRPSGVSSPPASSTITVSLEITLPGVTATS